MQNWPHADHQQEFTPQVPLAPLHRAEAASPPTVPLPPCNTETPVTSDPHPHDDEYPFSSKAVLDALERSNLTSLRIADALEGIQAAITRVADHVAPEPADIVGTGYIAKRLGCTTVWVAEMARKGDIPKNCIVPGTGNGKVWKFYRQRVDQWLIKR